MFKIGSIYSDKLNINLINKILNWKCECSECNNCKFEKRCRNDCIACNYDSTGNIYCPSSANCEISKIFIKESDKTLIKLIKNSTFKNYYSKLQENTEYSINLFDRQIEMILKEQQNVEHLCGATKSALGITCEGNILACSTCIGMNCENEFIIGNLGSGINKSKKEEFIQKLLTIQNKSKCDNCYFKNRCYSYCPSSNYLSSGNMYKVSRTMCELNKRLIKTSEQLLIQLYNTNEHIVQNKFLK